MEYQLPYGAWIRTLTANGFIVEDLVDLRPAHDAVSTYQPDAEPRWATQWPLESVWKARRRR